MNWLRGRQTGAGVIPGESPAPFVPDPAPAEQTNTPASTPVEPNRLTAAQDEVASQVRAELRLVLASGLSHLGQGTAERVSALATDAKVADLPLLARPLGTLAGQTGGLAERHGDVSERHTITTIAQAWALTLALQAADPEALPRLRGVARRSFDESPDTLDLVPLGASWWVATSGGRGVTLTMWDPAAAEVRTCTDARPPGIDESFSPSGVTMWVSSPM